MRCPYCNILIIHRFNGDYTTLDSKRRRMHMRICESNPDNVFKDIKSAQIKANLLHRFVMTNLQEAINELYEELDLEKSEEIEEIAKQVAKLQD